MTPLATLTRHRMHPSALAQFDALKAEPLNLAEHVSRGDAEALKTLIALYQPRVARLAHRLLGWSGDVDDVVQDVFMAVLRHGRRYRRDASIWTWLTTITVNQCRKRLRRRLLLKKLSSVLRSGQPPEEPDAAAIGDEIAEEVRSAVAALPPRDREVIVLFYLEHRSVAEMSRVLGAKANALDVRLHRARKRLRESLRHLMEQEQ